LGQKNENYSRAYILLKKMKIIVATMQMISFAEKFCSFEQ